MSENKVNEHNIIEVSDFVEAMRSVQPSSTPVEWNGLTINIKPCLSFNDMIRYVDFVSSACFDINTGEFMPEIKDFAIRCGAVAYFTNIAMPETVTEKYEMVYGSDLINVIMSYVDNGQMNSILIAIDSKVNYKANSNVERIHKELEAAVDAFEELNKSMTETFSGISNGDIAKIAESIVNGGFDEAKLVSLFTEKNLASGNDETTK